VPLRKSAAEKRADEEVENIYNNLVAQNEAAKAAREASGQGRVPAPPLPSSKFKSSNSNPVARNFGKRRRQPPIPYIPLPPPSTSSKSKSSVTDIRSKSVDQLYNEYKGRVSGTFDPTRLPEQGLDIHGSTVLAMG